MKFWNTVCLYKVSTVKNFVTSQLAYDLVWRRTLILVATKTDHHATIILIKGFWNF